MSEVGVTRDQIDIVRWTSSSDLGRRAAALLQRQNYGEGGKTVMKGVNLLGVPVGLLSVTFPDLPGAIRKRPRWTFSLFYRLDFSTEGY